MKGKNLSQAESRAWFEQIYYAYRKQMFCLARTLLQTDADAEDAVHTVFLQIASKHLPTLCKFTQPADLRNYLLKATKNTCLNQLRKRRRALDWEAFSENWVEDRQFLEQLCAKEEAALVRQAIDALPDHYRDVLYYHYILELPVQDVAKLTGRSAGTVKMQLVRGKKRLQDLLIKGGATPCP